MQNDMRDRLIKLIEDSLPNDNHIYFTKDIETMADELIANGVILLPIKKGDTVWHKEEKYILDSYKVNCIIPNIEIGASCISRDILFNLDDIGKTVFLTKDQAEQKLKEMRGDNDKK